MKKDFNVKFKKNKDQDENCKTNNLQIIISLKR